MFIPISCVHSIWRCCKQNKFLVQFPGYYATKSCCNWTLQRSSVADNLPHSAGLHENCIRWVLGSNSIFNELAYSKANLKQNKSAPNVPNWTLCSRYLSFLFFNSGGNSHIYIFSIRFVYFLILLRKINYKRLSFRLRNHEKRNVKMKDYFRNLSNNLL